VVANDSERLTIRTSRHPLGYILVSFDFGPPWVLQLMLHTGRPLSYVSYASYALLEAFGHIDTLGQDLYRLRGLRMGDHLAPDIVARVSIGPSLLGFDGLLGLQFLGQFSRVEFERDSGLLTLTY
jgi:hypothetical protein